MERKLKRNLKQESEQDYLPAIHQQVQVQFNYAVHFTRGLFQTQNPLLAEAIAPPSNHPPQSILAVVDAGFLEHRKGFLDQITQYAEFYSSNITLKAAPIIVPGGEAAKNDPKHLEKLHQEINGVGLCRHSYIVAIGGGAVLDLVGYAAATAHRGIRLLRVPTTVLAQNDSGVGVKNGINAFDKKNFLGTFAPPYAVFNDLDFLKTLDDRDWRSGMAEAIKVALIKDANFFDWIAAHAQTLAQRDMNQMQHLIYRCAQLHLEHIAQSGDPFEMGSSRPLDFGHWAAHRLEYLTYYRLRHGEAVAMGMALDSTYSYLMGLLPEAQWQQIISTLKTLGFALFVPEMMVRDRVEHSLQPNPSLFKGLAEFREHLGGELTLMLLQGIGQGLEVHEVDFEKYEKAIALLQPEVMV
ncbi:MAG: 3-dehydroquinate synthase [Oculatellaceae cyanobacterium Prado106]|nr:3-dehydroquinate synthase [Oculatellaceae cyanobacterium Prado106]